MTKTKQFGTFMTNCPPIVEELESSSTNPGTSPVCLPRQIQPPEVVKSITGRASRVDGFCMKILITAGSQSTKALRTLESVSGVRVTKTKQYGTFMTKCPPIVEELESSSTNPGTSPVCLPRQFYEVCDEHWRRSPKLDRLWKRSALCRSLQVNLKSLDCHLTQASG